MKKILSASVIALLMIVSYAIGRRHTAPAPENVSSRRVLYWVDPMHREYKSDHPGIAPDCGMALEPVYAEDADKAPPSAHLAQLPPGAVSIDGAVQRLVGIRVAWRDSWTSSSEMAPRVLIHLDDDIRCRRRYCDSLPYSSRCAARAGILTGTLACGGSSPVT